MTQSDPQQDPNLPTSSEPTVVGVGASAGGLAALKTFFANVPEDSDLAFVVVVHLAPDRESRLAELLQPHSRMPIRQVTETMLLEANHVYIIPPNANLSAIDTHLRPSELEEKRRERAPIDHFFRTLAKTHDGHAIGVVLTGTGSDGALGVKEIKEKGGLILVQAPNEAEYDGMPQSAIATGLVDLILPLAEIPQAILRFIRTRPQLPIPEEDRDLEGEERQLLHKIFAQLRVRTGRDFSRYKRSTIIRRITRRMQLVHLEELPAYLDRLRADSEECQALADDLLITVTNFFRDPAVFQKLEDEVIPRLFSEKGPGDDIRVWSVGCATGEEVYSLAILLLEAAARLETPPRIRLFASDLHERSLVKAREGFYPGDIERDVSTARLRRFFQKEDGGYRIRQEVRELVVFTPHNLLSDPPFSRLDLIACRNMLIYLQRDIQRDVIELFHYALQPDGWLVLGVSEYVDAADLFQTRDKRTCLYQKRNVPGPEPSLPVFPAAWPLLSGESAPRRPADELPAYGVLHQRLVERYAPPSLLISPDDKVVHLSEHAGRYLVHPGGALTASVFKLVREELRGELRAALHGARTQKTARRSRPVQVRFNGETGRVTLHVRPALEPDQEGFTLVIFDERDMVRAGEVDAREWTAGDPPLRPAIERLNQTEQRLQSFIESGRIDQQAQQAGEADPQSAGAVLRSLLAEVRATAAMIETGQTDLQRTNRERVRAEAELEHGQQRLQVVIEEYETSQEEMRAANEELQSANEELHSTMEELETSKEELQSMNEELQTVNQENRLKVEELAQLSGDLQNLLVATDIATLFLDRALRIMRFTPQVGRLFNVRPVDRGRPLSDLTHRLGYDDLAADAGQVLKKLIPIEREIEDERGRWYLTRLLPYRSAEDRIEGVVITFVDITRRKQTEEALREAKLYAESIIDNLHEPLLVLTPDLRVRSANPAFYNHFQIRPEETQGRLIYELANNQWNIPALRTLLEDVLPENNVFNDFEVEHEFETIGRRVMLLNGRRLDQVQLILLGIRDITTRKQAEEDLRRLNQQLEQRVAERTLELAEQNQRLRQLALQLTEIEQQERRKIAQTLHNGLQSLLVGIKMQLASALKADDSDLGDQIDDLLDQALDITRTLSYELSPPTLHSTDLPEALRWLAEWVQTHHHFAVEIAAAGDFPPLPDQIKLFLYDAVRELLLNAVKHSESVGARVELRLAQAGQVAVVVSDEGIGFDPDHPEQAGVELRGFGLFSIRERLTALGGNLQIDSTPADGARFILTAPTVGTVAHREPPQAAAGPAPPVERARPSSKKAATRPIRVLIVDDHHIIRQELTAMLGHEADIEPVGQAVDGLEAVEKAADLRPDVVVMDIDMPRMNGVEATRQIKESYPDIKIIGLSIHEEAIQGEKMRQAGASAYLSKGGAFDVLLQTIRDLFESVG